jgi:predicted pyridoxine 5'-phosphate oxidase superfamily flavin-nucleotide-binding protein
MYHDGSRELQDRFGSRQLADRLAERLTHDTFSAEDRDFIQSRPLFFLATADAEGRPDCSYKGGDPGFVRVIDPSTLAFPSYDGNGMFKSLGNLLTNPHVGMLFIDFESPRRLRVRPSAAEAWVRTSSPRLTKWRPRALARATPARSALFSPTSKMV